MNVFDLFATLSLDSSKYDEGLSDAESRAGSIGGTIAKGLGIAGAAAGAAIGAAATGVATLTTESVKAYGEFEQLAGGIEKLYGDAADAMVGHAQDAFATTGMDANSYMQSVTSFSAALINSLDGDVDAASEIADMAMRDLADNANVFGVQTAEELSNVYMNLARGQFQTLDSLNLGYAGTQEGMLQLINDSGIFEEQLESLDGVSFDQMLQAIHEVQTQMNITGTTENEAAGTIQGSINMLSAAWQNLVTGMADGDADLESLIDNVVESAGYAVENLAPAVTQALGGIATLIQEVAPIIVDQLPGIIDTVLPPLLSASISIVTALVQALPSIISAISAALPQILSTLIPAIISVTPMLIEAGGELLMGLANGLADNADLLLDTVIDVIHILVDDFLTPDNIESFINVAVEIILTISTALLEHAPELVGAAIILISNIIVALAESLPDIAVQIGNFIADLGEDLGNWLYDMFGDGLVKVIDGLAQWWDKVTTFGSDVLTKAGEIGADVIESIVTFFSDAWENFTTGFSDIIGKIEGFGDDVWEKFTGIFEDAKSIVSGAIDELLGFFDFDWELPEIKLPHFNVSGGEAPWGFGGQGSLPSVGVEWYKKAYNQPILLNDPTIFGYGDGRALGGGDSYGGELIMGYNQLLQAISRATNQTVVVPVYIGGEQIDEFVVQSNQRNDFIGGGRG